ncbi:potassium transporter Trk [Tenacibaculum discolor]|uniref:NAD(P)/FAD-dependent oxidoreductase n=1 Tax=Tenacibaculum discolor TaxID=361581 RepID=A0A2G1BS99_9FLAO|nr:NAD(P)/FAD-dependent oxidoreductase [Tenacibaculum discolor]MDP2540932.1 NAD(P)/FAD-dependent oxidoreductase [Tenacibaculum discolor]PHN96455.1 potassium transporter Trk [Tenacibaculum discolor]PHO00334.1 potassium transporter Trk [Rhodobacteraceae bacterium 4F10]
MLDFVIIGGAQAGLSMAYHLKKMEKSFIVVDGEEEIGASWLNRWDSLKLFTPTEYNHLPGLKFNAPKGHYPSKYEVSDYFKSYVKKFDIPVQLNTLVTSVKKSVKGFHVIYNEGEILAKNIIVATGPFHIPYTPPCHTKLSDEVLQMHSNYYKNSKQLQEGDVLVVGGGDSGYQILDEISKDKKSKTVYFSGDTKVKTLPQQFLGKTLWWWFTLIGFLKFNKYSWIGKKISTSLQPVIGTDVKEILSRENVVTVGRTKDALDNEVVFENKKVTSIKNIIWATGYRPNFKWIEGLELDSDNYPKNYRGVSNIEGLYFIGLPWMYTRGSATLGGVSKDASYLADIISKK